MACSVAQCADTDPELIPEEIDCYDSYRGVLWLKLLPDSDSLEVELEVPPMRLDDFSKEYFVRFMSNIENSQKWYTDENGWTLKWHEFEPSRPLGKSMRPVTRLIGVEDTQGGRGMQVQTDRSQAGVVPQSGHVYMLVNRIHLYVDNGGIPDPLQVNGPLN